eukprot:29048-Amphidinium_carterae.1
MTATSNLRQMFNLTIKHYVSVTVEKDGWDAVDWKGGFTILHWAAEHGRVELCTRLMTAKGRFQESRGLYHSNLTEFAEMRKPHRNSGNVETK